MINNCYIHIPFCKNICSYCDFCKLFYNEKLVDQYLEQLEKEISNIYRKEELKTIYIGGGTPSCLNMKQLNKLFSITKKLRVSKDVEFSIECNFDSINKEKLLLFKENGVNRLSFGLESTIDKNLKLLNREENCSRVQEIISYCRELGFKNINIDLMYAIPDETTKDLERDLNFILSLNVEHISTYSLIIEEHTKLYINQIKTIKEELDYEMYKIICNKLKNYHHYEISNFSKYGYESRHNMCYWKNKNYYGFGLGASSYIGNKRINNTRSITKYLQNKTILDMEILNKSDIMSYEMILGLRMLNGVNKESFYKKYNKDIYEAFDIKGLISKDLLIDDGINIYIPLDKMYISNEILVNFIKE